MRGFQSLRIGRYFRRLWFLVCVLLLAVSVAASIRVYLQVSRELAGNMEQHLLLETRYYRARLDQVVLRAAYRLDNLIRSPTARYVLQQPLQDELDLLPTGTPGLTRCWVAYADGRLVLSSSTRPDYVRRLPWWRDFLAGRTPTASLGYVLSRSQAMLGEPFLNEAGTVTLPLISLGLEENVRIVRAAGFELDLNRAVLDDTVDNNADWSKDPVSVYTSEGILLANPYYYTARSSQLLTDCSDHPLVQQGKKHPESDQGFLIYSQDGRQTAGVFLRDPFLRVVLTAERPAKEVVDPVRRIATGPLIIAVLCLLVATLFIATLYSDTRRLRMADRHARQVEFRALQAHINPHFLFNTLNRIMGMAESSGNLPIVDMIRSLADIFRYTTRNPDAMVPLQEELQYLGEYIKLQAARYKDRFSFSLSVPDDLLSAPVFKFCIQPLVENCFLHGMEKSLEPVEIWVNVARAGQALEVTVRDDGPGMSPERLADMTRILQEVERESGSLGNGVGLSNIHHRLRLAYGSQFGVRLEPAQPGLIVHLRLPLLEGIQRPHRSTGLESNRSRYV